MQKLPVLTSERVILRPFLQSDGKRVQELAGAKEIASTTLNIPHPYKDGLAEEWIRGHEKDFLNDKSIALAICLKDTEVLIGAIGLIIYRSDSRGSLGYWIGNKFWNNGYCTEAAKVMMKYGFEQMNLHRIYATHLSHNSASGRVMQKLGMKYEGVLRHHVNKWGRFYDLVYFGILKSEYLSM